MIVDFTIHHKGTYTADSYEEAVAQWYADVALRALALVTTVAAAAS